MTTGQIIDKLRDDEHYYGEFGSQFLSNSNIKTLLKNPLGLREPSKTTVPFLVGGYFHTAILEPDKIKNFKVLLCTFCKIKMYTIFWKPTNKNVLYLNKIVPMHISIFLKLLSYITFFFFRLFCQLIKTTTKGHRSKHAHEKAAAQTQDPSERQAGNELESSVQVDTSNFKTRSNKPGRRNRKPKKVRTVSKILMWI